jgi:hypothetical protein
MPTEEKVNLAKHYARVGEISLDTLKVARCILILYPGLAV